MDDAQGTRHTDYAALLRESGIPQRSRDGTFEHVLERIDALPRGRVLDAPCGPGLMCDALRRLGFDVTGADLDAKQFELHGHVGFEAIDLDGPLPFEDRRFDVVHCGDGIEHIENPFALMREFARVLAVDGLLVVVTPNYLNIESRMRFLFTGAMTKPVERHPTFAQRAKIDRGHISPLTLVRLARIAEYAGFDLMEFTTVLAKPRQRLLAPLAALVKLYGHLLRPVQRERLFADATNSWLMLLGGKQLVAVFRKRSQAC